MRGTETRSVMDFARVELSRPIDEKQRSPSPRATSLATEANAEEMVELRELWDSVPVHVLVSDHLCEQDGIARQALETPRRESNRISMGRHVSRCAAHLLFNPPVFASIFLTLEFVGLWMYLATVSNPTTSGASFLAELFSSWTMVIFPFALWTARSYFLVVWRSIDSALFYKYAEPSRDDYALPVTLQVNRRVLMLDAAARAGPIYRERVKNVPLEAFFSRFVSSLINMTLFMFFFNVGIVCLAFASALLAVDTTRTPRYLRGNVGTIEGTFPYATLYSILFNFWKDTTWSMRYTFSPGFKYPRLRREDVHINDGRGIV